MVFNYNLSVEHETLNNSEECLPLIHLFFMKLGIIEHHLNTRMFVMYVTDP